VAEHADKPAKAPESKPAAEHAEKRPPRL
jgi:hypothetical protein